MKTIAVLLACFAVACGGDVFDPNDGGGGDAGSDAPPCDKCVDAGPFACGDTFCSGANAVCVHPCCGGAILCEARDDGGGCPDGLQVSTLCPPGQPCSNVCTPPPPYCGTTQDCNMGNGHDCYLVCQ